VPPGPEARPGGSPSVWDGAAPPEGVGASGSAPWPRDPSGVVFGAGFDLALAEESALGPLSRPTGANYGGSPPLPTRSTLPGGGSPGEGCGTIHAVGWLCRSGSHARPRVPVAPVHCDRRECPVCAGPHTAKECALGLPHGGGRWAHDEAERAVRKLRGYLGTLPGYRALRQVIVSPPPERFTEGTDDRRTVARVRSAAVKAVSELAWGPGRADYRAKDGKYRRGAFGSVVVHLYRGCERDGYDRWGPHAHVLTGGIDARRTEEYQARTGVVVKQATDREGRFIDYRGHRLLRHVVYELGHAAILSRCHAVSYFGTGLIQYHPPDEPEPELPSAPSCPECGSAMETLADSGYHVSRTVEGGWGLTYYAGDGVRFVPVETYTDDRLRRPPDPETVRRSRRSRADRSW